MREYWNDGTMGKTLTPPFILRTLCFLRLKHTSAGKP